MASHSVPVAIESRRIFAVPLDLARRNPVNVDVMTHDRHYGASALNDSGRDPGLEGL